MEREDQLVAPSEHPVQHRLRPLLQRAAVGGSRDRRAEGGKDRGLVLFARGRRTTASPPRPVMGLSHENDPFLPAVRESPA